MDKVQLGERSAKLGRCFDIQIKEGQICIKYWWNREEYFWSYKYQIAGRGNNKYTRKAWIDWAQYISVIVIYLHFDYLFNLSNQVYNDLAWRRQEASETQELPEVAIKECC